MANTFSCKLLMINPLTKSDLIHYKIQAAMRENTFSEDQMKYIGVRDGKHLYLIDGKHEVFADQFEEFEMIDDE
jgi:hypothetical protein